MTVERGSKIKLALQVLEDTLADGAPLSEKQTFIDACVKAGINKGTAAVQYGKWKKAKEKAANA